MEARVSRHKMAGYVVSSCNRDGHGQSQDRHSAKAIKSSNVPSPGLGSSHIIYARSDAMSLLNIPTGPQ